jgi:hypothetical protein
MIAFCPGCDLGFCEEHVGAHSKVCRMAPSLKYTVEYEGRYGTVIPCAVCAGRWRMPEREETVKPETTS